MSMDGPGEETPTPIEYLGRHLIKLGVELFQQRFYLEHGFSI